MRIRRLVVEGFGPFARRQEIDFAALDAAGLFLITGRTGSGKSSILDAVCFALYGGAPRYDGARARLRSDHARPEDPTRVELEFEAAGDRWRVVRSPEYLRPKRRGDGFTTQREEAQVFRWEGDGWRGLAARAADLPEILDPVLQLNREQFLQVILLAQGRFQEFLRARSEERVQLLRALFGTQRFAAFEAELVQRTRTLEQRIAAADAEAAADLIRLGELAGEDGPPSTEQADEVVDALRDRADEALAAAARARDAFAAADAAHGEQVRIGRLQHRRAEATTGLAMLEQQDPAVDRDRTRVTAALRALPAAPAAARAARAKHERAAAEQGLDAAARAVDGEVVDAARDAAALDGAIGGLVGAVTEEAALPGLRQEVDRATSLVRRAEAGLAAIEAEAERIPAQRAEVVAAQQAALAGAAVLPEARAAVLRAEQALDAAGSAERLARRLEDADERHRSSLLAERDAADRTLRLVDARAAGAAGLLAETLHDGSACPVCGSVEHPAPARSGADRVDDAAVTAAQRAQERAAGARADASDAAARLRADLAAARSAAGGVTVRDAERALGEARTGASAAEAASAESGRADAALRSLDDRAEAVRTRRERARADLREHEATLTAARSRSDEAATRVEAARAGHDRVSGRVEVLRRRRDLLRALDLATRSAATARAEDEDAARLLAEALAEAGFDTVDELRTAALAPSEREALELRVRQHDRARTTATAQLADPEVAAAPQQPADVDGAARLKGQALEAQRTAMQREADLGGRAQHAAALQQRVRGRVEATADAREQLRVLSPLSSAVRGDNAKRMRLEAYVLAARLEQIVAAANLRLATMTDGRYTLRHDDSLAERGARSGLGLEVMDEHTGRTRQIASLSGGETFLASLALALGLAEVVSDEAGGVRLDTLFVDEGFGSLDRQTLDTAMETLDSLRAGGRVVGLISHVEGMQEDIPAGLHVERDPDGSSSVRLRAPAPAPAPA